MSSEDNNELPDVKEQGKNLAKFTFEVVKDTISLSKPLFVPKNIEKERLDICNACEYYMEKYKRCKMCGCFMEAKTKFSTSECPDGRWSKFEWNGIN